MILEVNNQTRSNRLRLAELWLKKIPELQRTLDGLGVSYPKRHVSESKDEYRLRLIETIIDNEPRIA
jgi:hypothetical protein